MTENPYGTQAGMTPQQPGSAPQQPNYAPQQPNYDQQQYYTGAMPVQGYDAQGNPHTAAMPVQGGQQPAPGQYQQPQNFQQPGVNYTGEMPNLAAAPAVPAAPSEFALSVRALLGAFKAVLKGNADGVIDAIVGRKQVWWLALAKVSFVTSLFAVAALSRLRSTFWEGLVSYLPEDARANMYTTYVRDEDYGSFSFGQGVGIVAIGFVVFALCYLIRAVGVDLAARLGGAKLPFVASLSISAVGQIPFVLASFVAFVLTVIPGDGFARFSQWIILPLMLMGWLMSEMLTYANLNRVVQFTKPTVLTYAAVSGLSTYVGAFISLLILFQIGGQIIGS